MGKILDKYIELRKVGGSLYLRVPASFIHNNGLSDGDWILFEPEKFKFVRKEHFDSLAQDPVEAAMCSE